jgi:hypothetical protein
MREEYQKSLEWGRVAESRIAKWLLSPVIWTVI